MESLLKSYGLCECWQAGKNIALFRRRFKCYEIDLIDVPQKCENILKLVKNLRISWSVIGELVLGNVRIYQMQVEYLYENALVLFVNRPPVQRKRQFSSTAQRKYQPKSRSKESEFTNTQKNRQNSDITLPRYEPKRARRDCFDPDLNSDFLSMYEELPEENLQEQIAAPDVLTTHNSAISLVEPIPVQEQSINDDAYYFGPASYHEFEEFMGFPNQRNICEHITQISVQVHPSPNTGHRRCNSSQILADKETPAKRRRIWENNFNQEDINEILPADDLPLAANETNPTNIDDQLPEPDTTLDSLPELTHISQKQFMKRRMTSKIQFRDLVTELKMPRKSDKLDFRLSLRQRELIHSIPKKLYNPLERSKIYTFPARTESSSSILKMVRPTMAGSLVNQYQRNLKTTKKTQTLKEKNLNAVTLLDEFFNKSTNEHENLSYDEIRNQPQQIANIEELDVPVEPMELSSPPCDVRAGLTSITTNIRNISGTNSYVANTCVFEREPSGSLPPTEISNENISLTSAVESQFTISDNTSDRFVDELNINGSRTQTNTQIEWGPSGLLKKLYHLWNVNCELIDMKMVCRGASKKCAAHAFFSLMVLQSTKFQYVVLENDIGSNTIRNIKRNVVLDDLFLKFLEK